MVALIGVEEAAMDIGETLHAEEPESRLKNFLNATEKGRQIGYGGIDKYF